MGKSWESIQEDMLTHLSTVGMDVSQTSSVAMVLKPIAKEMELLYQQNENLRKEISLLAARQDKVISTIERFLGNEPKEHRDMLKKRWDADWNFDRGES